MLLKNSPGPTGKYCDKLSPGCLPYSSRFIIKTGTCAERVTSRVWKKKWVGQEQREIWFKTNENIRVQLPDTPCRRRMRTKKSFRHLESPPTHLFSMNISQCLDIKYLGHSYTMHHNQAQQNTTGSWQCSDARPWVYSEHFRLRSAIL